MNTPTFINAYTETAGIYNSQYAKNSTAKKQDKLINTNKIVEITPTDDLSKSTITYLAGENKAAVAYCDLSVEELNKKLNILA